MGQSQGMDFEKKAPHGISCGISYGNRLMWHIILPMWFVMSAQGIVAFFCHFFPEDVSSNVKAGHFQ